MNEVEELLTEDEKVSLLNFGFAINTLTEVLVDDDATPAALRMAVAQCRAGADVLEGVAARWEEKLREQE